MPLPSDSLATSLPLPPNWARCVELTKDLRPAGAESGDYHSGRLFLIATITFFAVFFLLLLGFISIPLTMAPDSGSPPFFSPFEPFLFFFVLLFPMIQWWSDATKEMSKGGINRAAPFIGPLLSEYVVEGETVLGMVNFRRLGGELWMTGTSQGGLLVLTTHRLIVVSTKPSTKPVFDLIRSPSEVRLQVCDFSDPFAFGVGGLMWPLGLNLAAFSLRFTPLGPHKPIHCAVSPKDGPNAELFHEILRRRAEVVGAPVRLSATPAAGGFARPSRTGDLGMTCRIALAGAAVDYVPPRVCDRVAARPVLNVDKVFSVSHSLIKQDLPFGAVVLTNDPRFGQEQGESDLLAASGLKGRVSVTGARSRVEDGPEGRITRWSIEFDLDGAPRYASIAVLDVSSAGPKHPMKMIKMMCSFWGDRSEADSLDQLCRDMASTVSIASKGGSRGVIESAVVYIALAYNFFAYFAMIYMRPSLGFDSDIFADSIMITAAVPLIFLVFALYAMVKRKRWLVVGVPSALILAALSSLTMYWFLQFEASIGMDLFEITPPGKPAFGGAGTASSTGAGLGWIGMLVGLQIVVNIIGSAAAWLFRDRLVRDEFSD